jgi:hypothetical protein
MADYEKEYGKVEAWGSPKDSTTTTKNGMPLYT